MSVTLEQLQAEAEAISGKSPAIRRFALDAVSYLREQAQPIPIPVPPEPVPVPPTHSDKWHVYGPGDPSWHGGGWYFGGANGQGDATSTGWGRQAGDGSNTSQRVTLGTDGRITCAIQPNDPSVGGIASGAQVSLVGLFPSTLYSLLPSPSNPLGTPSAIWNYPAAAMPYPKEGETWTYRYQFLSNPEYVPHGARTADLIFGNFNECGLEWHVHNAAANGALGPLSTAVATTRGTNVYPNANGYYYTAPQSMIPLGAPRLEWQLTAGDSSLASPNVNNPTNTCLRFQGPLWTSGRVYDVIQSVTWSATPGKGALRVETLEADGWTTWVDIGNVATLWRNGATVDTLTYPQFQNYRKADTSLPTATFYYDGFTRGISREDVAA